MEFRKREKLKKVSSALGLQIERRNFILPCKLYNTIMWNPIWRSILINNWSWVRILLLLENDVLFISKTLLGYDEALWLKKWRYVMPVKFWQTILRFWFFLSYLITTVPTELNGPPLKHSYYFAHSFLHKIFYKKIFAKHTVLKLIICGAQTIGH